MARAVGEARSGETLRSGAARELYEETGVRVDPGRLRLVHTVHHRQSPEIERIGFFFEATEWEGEPENREPAKCLDLRWFSVHELPEDIIEYPAAGLYGYLDGGRVLTEHGFSGGRGGRGALGGVRPCVSPPAVD